MCIISKYYNCKEKQRVAQYKNKKKCINIKKGIDFKLILCNYKCSKYILKIYSKSLYN